MKNIIALLLVRIFSKNYYFFDIRQSFYLNHKLSKTYNLKEFDEPLQHFLGNNDVYQSLLPAMEDPEPFGRALHKLLHSDSKVPSENQIHIGNNIHFDHLKRVNDSKICGKHDSILRYVF